MPAIRKSVVHYLHLPAEISASGKYRPVSLEAKALVSIGFGRTLRRASLAQDRLKTEVLLFPKPFTGRIPPHGNAAK
jgi:hypothetical protein